MGGLGVIGPEKFAQYFTGHPALSLSGVLVMTLHYFSVEPAAY
jgi:hypothetical protein